MRICGSMFCTSDAPQASYYRKPITLCFEDPLNGMAYFSLPCPSVMNATIILAYTFLSKGALVVAYKDKT